MAERINISPEQHDYNKIALEISETVQGLEIGYDPEQINLIGGDKGSNDYELNKARRQTARDLILSMLVDLFKEEGITDEIQIKSFSKTAEKHITGAGKSDLHALYYAAAINNTSEVSSRLESIYKKLYKEHFIKLTPPEYLSPEMQEQVIPDEIGKETKRFKKEVKQRSGLELDKATLKALSGGKSSSARLEQKMSETVAPGQMAIPLHFGKTKQSIKESQVPKKKTG